MGTTGAGEDMGPHTTTAAQTGAAALGAGTTLTAEIRRVLARVDAHALRGTKGEERQAHAPVPVQESADGPGTAPLDALVTCFGLTAFERDLVLLTAAQELEPTAAARCAAACGDPERAHPTFSLALAARLDANCASAPGISRRSLSDCETRSAA